MTYETLAKEVNFSFDKYLYAAEFTNNIIAYDPYEVDRKCVFVNLFNDDSRDDNVEYRFIFPFVNAIETD